MNFKKTLLASSISLMLLGLNGCGDGDNQDMAADEETSFTGLVVDGRIARGFVWADTDQDGIIDMHEPYAYTDVNGYFGYNPLTNTDYCHDDNEKNDIYCLSTGMLQGDAQLKIAGGIDLATGEPFKGVMTLNINVDDAKAVEEQIANITSAQEAKPEFMPVISPLSSMIPASATAEQKVAILEKLGVTDVTTSNVDELLSKDYTDLADGDDTKIMLFLTAFQNQLLLDKISGMLDQYLADNNIDLSTSLTGGDGTPGLGSTADLVTMIMSQLLAEEDSSAGKFGTKSANAIDTTTFFQRLIDATFVQLAEAGIDVAPTPAIATSNIDESFKFLGDLFDDTRDLLDNLDSNETNKINQVNAALIGMWVIADTAHLRYDLENETDEDDLSRALARSQYPLFQSIFAILEGDNELDLTVFMNDIISISEEQQEEDINWEAIISNIANKATLPKAPNAGEQGIWAKRVLSMSGKSKDSASGQYESGRALFFFDSTDNMGIEGDVSVCYAFNAIRDKNDIEPTYMTATWAELASRGVIKVDHQLASFTIKVLKKAPIPDVKEVVGIGDGISETANYGHFRFVHDGKDNTWYSDREVVDVSDIRDYGLVDIVGSVPTNSTECASYNNGILTKNLGTF